MAGTLPSPTLTGRAVTGTQQQESTLRLSLSRVLGELVLGAAFAAVLSLVLQFAIARLGISEPSYAPEALAALSSVAVVAVMFAALAFGRRRTPRWHHVAGVWATLSAFSTFALAIPLQATRFYYGGSTTDNAFRMQYMTRMASTPGLADMNYADMVPYYPAGWFWLGGRFANLIGWEGWAAYKPYALTWMAVTGVVAFTLWSVVLRRRVAALLGLVTALAGMLNHGVMEPYAWPSAAWLPPVAVITWYALRREDRAPRGALVGVGIFVGFAAITYTLHFGFAVLLIVAMAVVLGVFRVRRGHRVGPTVSRLFLRLLPIGLISLALALIVWAPFVIAGGLAHGSAAQHYLPEDSAFLPTPMAKASMLGVLLMAGLLWMLLRCRHSDIAASLLTVVVAVYCWFGLSTLALAAKTTLLAFRLEVVLTTALATAGVLGLLELVGHLRGRFEKQQGPSVTTVSCVLGLIGTVTLTQGAIGTTLADPAESAYKDYYPTGTTAMGHHDPDESGAWLDELSSTVHRMTGRSPSENVVLSTNYDLMSYEAYWGFQQETPHYANPLADYERRSAEIRRWTRADSPRELLNRMRGGEFTPPDVLVLRNEPKKSDGESGGQQRNGAGGTSSTDRHTDKLTLTLKADAFPQQPNVRNYTVGFEPGLFDSPAFTRREVGPYTVITVRR